MNKVVLNGEKKRIIYIKVWSTHGVNVMVSQTVT